MVSEELPWHDKGYQKTKWLADGRAAAFDFRIFGASIKVGDADDEFGYSEAYDYESDVACYLAFAEWRGEPGTEPSGWVRHIPSYRRRPDGNPAREYVAP